MKLLGFSALLGTSLVDVNGPTSLLHVLHLDTSPRCSSKPGSLRACKTSAKVSPPSSPSCDESNSQVVSADRDFATSSGTNLLTTNSNARHMSDKLIPLADTGSISNHLRLSRQAALVLLNSVAVLWGSQHAVIKIVLTHSDVSPAALSFARFALAAVAVLPFMPQSIPVVRAAAAPGLELGVWMFLGYAAQAVGLLSTSAARSGFLLYMNVKLVPLFAAALYRRNISRRVWTSAALAFLGTVILSYDGSPPNIGDIWSILAAAASAMFILRMESATGSLDVNPNALNAFALTTVTLLSGLWLGMTGELTQSNFLSALHASPTSILPVVYLGIVTTALSNWLQALGQRAVSAEQAAIIFAMDPVYGALFAYLLLGEHFGPQGLAGVTLIGVAAFISNHTTRDTA